MEPRSYTSYEALNEILMSTMLWITTAQGEI